MNESYLELFRLLALNVEEKKKDFEENGFQIQCDFKETDKA